MEPAGEPLSAEVVERLVANHRQFLSFLESRVKNRAVAEEILQAAFVRAVEKGDSIRDKESAVAWFYRLLRNAIIDQHRKGATEARALAEQAAGADEAIEPEMKAAICTCMNALLPTLKPEYAEMIRRVDLEEGTLADAASALSITPNNAAVRLHRARKALKERLERSCGTCATHGCLDCTCGEGGCG